MIINQHRFRICLGATRQQAITWANVDPDLYCYIVSLGHQELTRSVAPVHHEVIIRHNCLIFKMGEVVIIPVRLWFPTICFLSVSPIKLNSHSPWNYTPYLIYCNLSCPGANITGPANLNYSRVTWWPLVLNTLRIVTQWYKSIHRCSSSEQLCRESAHVTGLIIIKDFFKWCKFWKWKFRSCENKSKPIIIIVI